MSILRQDEPAKQEAGHDDKMQLHDWRISKGLLIVDLHTGVTWERESPTWDHHDKVEHGGAWITSAITITHESVRNVSIDERRLRKSSVRVEVHLRPNICSDCRFTRSTDRQDYAYAVPPRCGKAAPPDDAHCLASQRQRDRVARGTQIRTTVSTA